MASIGSMQMSLKAANAGMLGSKVSNRGTPVCKVASAKATKMDTKVSCVATPDKAPVSFPAKRSAVEIIKEDSDYLRHPLMEELTTSATNINEAAMQLMKFHGSYQQDHREKRAFGQGKSYQFMMRTRQPSGFVTNQLYLVMDDLADQYGNGTLRLTTRQTYQLHGVMKGDLKTVFSSVIKAMGSTLGACGDVNRNVMGPPSPIKNFKYIECEKTSNDIADLLAPQAGSYYDVWLDGEKFMSSQMESPEVTKARADNSFGTNFDNSVEPIYGTQFLPRKFKVAVTVPGDNSIDLFTNDLGIVLIFNDDETEVVGYNLYVGGGMGRTHRNADTFPYLAESLGFVAKDDLFYAVKAVVACQRDYGRRDDRKQARLKYLIATWGIDKFRTVTEQYFGKSFQAEAPLPAWEMKTYLGWMDQGDGKEAYGISVMNGRLKGAQKMALRQVIERYELPVRLTGNQDIILCDIAPAWKQDIVDTLSKAGVVHTEDVDGIFQKSIACPAMPLCGLAIGEAERGLPQINTRLRAVMNKCGLKDLSPVIRMTGCPNGCARPYMAEIGFVADGPNSYQIWLAGCPAQTRLAQEYCMKMKVADLEKFFEPLFYFYKTRSADGEAFGDFCNRVGLDVLKKYQEVYVPPPTIKRLPRVMVEEEAFEALKAAAEEKGTTLSELASKAITEYLN